MEPPPLRAFVPLREVAVVNFPVVSDDALSRDSEGLQGEGVNVFLEH